MFFSSRTIAAAILTVLLCSEEAASHSWVEKLQGANGELGFIRKWNGREPIRDGNGNMVGVDDFFTYKLEGPGYNQSPICKEKDKINFQFPRLRAHAGEEVIGYWLENGHITRQPIEGPNGSTGSVRWYGTESYSSDTTLGEVRAWTGDGQGGNKEGRLIGENPFDDRICAESNNSKVSSDRQVGLDKPTLPCKGSFTLPGGLKPGSTYTVYWVWDFSNKADVNQRTEEWYTSCMDIDII